MVSAYRFGCSVKVVAVTSGSEVRGGTTRFLDLGAGLGLGEGLILGVGFDGDEDDSGGGVEFALAVDLTPTLPVSNPCRLRCRFTIVG